MNFREFDKMGEKPTLVMSKDTEEVLFTDNIDNIVPHGGLQVILANVENRTAR